MRDFLEIYEYDGITRIENHSETHSLLISVKSPAPKRKVSPFILVMPGDFKMVEYGQLDWELLVLSWKRVRPDIIMI